MTPPAEHPTRSTRPPKGKKARKHNLILAGAVFGVLIVAYVIYRSRKQAAAAPTLTSPAPSSGTVAGATGTVAGAGTGTPTDHSADVVAAITAESQANQAAFAGFQSNLTPLTGEVHALSSPQQPAGAPPGLTPAPAAGSASGAVWGWQTSNLDLWPAGSVLPDGTVKGTGLRYNPQSGFDAQPGLFTPIPGNQEPAAGVEATQVWTPTGWVWSTINHNVLNQENAAFKARRITAA